MVFHKLAHQFRNVPPNYLMIYLNSVQFSHPLESFVFLFYYKRQANKTPQKESMGWNYFGSIYFCTCTIILSFYKIQDWIKYLSGKKQLHKNKNLQKEFHPIVKYIHYSVCHLGREREKKKGRRDWLFGGTCLTISLNLSTCLKHPVCCIVLA